VTRSPEIVTLSARRHHEARGRAAYHAPCFFPFPRVGGG
jgi:hypothetical protein